MKNIYYLLFVCLLPSNLFAQNDYYATDNFMLTGVKLVNGTSKINSQYCQVFRNNVVLQYTPDQIKEYGFKGGQVYKSFAVKLNNKTSRYFLEQLAKGKINLYYLRASKGVRKYYITTSDTSALIEIPSSKEEFSVFTNKYINDCPSAVNSDQRIKIKKNSLTRYINDYNVCAHKIIPPFDYGFYIGITKINLNAIEQRIYPIPNKVNAKSLTIGAFMNIPLYFCNLSFHPEINYKQLSNAIPIVKYNTYNDLTTNISTLDFPFLLRYSIIKNKFCPFFQAGAVYSRSLKNESTLYQYMWKDDNTVVISTNKFKTIEIDRGGFSLGAGLIFKLATKYSVFTEIRYCKLYNLTSGACLFNNNEMTFSFGILL